MTHPAPTDIVGSLAWIMDRLEAIEGTRRSPRLNCVQAARALGLSEGYMHGRPWRVPAFGAGGRYLTLGEWEDWLSRPDAERRAEWDALPEAQRRKIRGGVHA